MFQKAFRPRTAREAFRLAGRIADKEAKQEPKQSFSLLFDNTVSTYQILLGVKNIYHILNYYCMSLAKL